MPSDSTDGASSTPRVRLARLWEALDRPDSAALHGLMSGAVWFVIGTLIGLLMSDELVMPDWFAGVPQLLFSRLRPAHVQMLILGFFSTAYFGAWYFLVPRLCKTPLRSNRAANLLLFFWNIAIVVGTVALMNGDTQGREYAEYPWYVDWPAEILMVVNLVIFFRTVAARREPKLYVSLWYIGGTMVWGILLYYIGNVMWHPLTTYRTADGHLHFLWDSVAAASVLPDGAHALQRTGAFVGLNDAVWNWFYAHNILGLWVTTGGIAIVYYLVPKISKRPLYSHTMSLIGFWALALLYANTGQHHLLQAPIPNWLKVFAIIGSVSLIVPVFSQNVNIFMTMRGEWGQMLTNIPLRFVLTGQFFYLAVSFQGSVQSFMSVNRFVHFTQWTIAHAHLALPGAFGFITAGAMLYMVPQIVRRPLWSRNLADAQYWLMMVGIQGYFWSITAAGLAQASAAVNLGQQWVRLFPVVKPYFEMRSWFGALIVIGVLMQLVNLAMTVLTPAPDAAARRRQAIADLQELPAPALNGAGVAVVD